MARPGRRRPPGPKGPSAKHGQTRRLSAARPGGRAGTRCGPAAGCGRATSVPPGKA